MEKKIFLRQFIALGLKTRENSSRYGEGHNMWVEAGFSLALADQARLAFKKVLAQVDHKALGVDHDLGFDPTTANLCAYLAEKLEAEVGEKVEVSLKRGDFSSAQTL